MKSTGLSNGSRIKLVAFLAFGVLIALPVRSNLLARQASGIAVDGYTLALSAQKTSYAVGEHVIVTVAVTNSGATSLHYIDDCTERSGTLLTVTNSSGAQVGPHLDNPTCIYSGPGSNITPDHLIAPGAQYSTQFDLFKSYASLPTGTLNVQAERPVSPTATAKSNVIQITVGS